MTVAGRLQPNRSLEQNPEEQSEKVSVQDYLQQTDNKPERYTCMSRLKARAGRGSYRQLNTYKVIAANDCLAAAQGGGTCVQYVM